MPSLPPVVVELRANASEFKATMGQVRKDVSKLSTESAGHFAKLRAAAVPSLLAVGTAAIGLGAETIHMADTFEKSHAKLVTALKNSGSSFDAERKQVEAAQQSMTNFGFSNDQTQEALANLTTSLGSPKKALDQMGLAADLATYKHIGLADAAIAVARAEEGNLRALKQLGIDLPINAKNAEGLKVAQQQLAIATETYQAQLARVHEKHTVTAADLASLKVAQDRLKFAQDQVNEAQHAGTLIVDALNKKIGGQASAAADTFAGKQAKLKAELENVGQQIGLKLIPVVETMIDDFTKVYDWVKRNEGVLKPLVGTIAGLAGAVYAVNRAQRLWNSAAAAINTVEKVLKIDAQTRAYQGLATAAGEAAGAETAAGSAGGVGGVGGAVGKASKIGKVARALPIIGTVVAGAAYANSVTSGENSRSLQRLTDAATASVAGLASVQAEFHRVMASIPEGVLKSTGLAKQFQKAIDAGTAAMARNRDAALIAQAAQIRLSAGFQAAEAAIRKMTGSFGYAEAAAKTGGFVIGSNLTAGIIIGIRQGADRVALESVKVVNGALVAARRTAALGSPSKIMIQYGQWMSEGLAIGLRNGASFVESTVQALTKSLLADVYEAASSSATTAVSAVVDQMAQLKQTIAQGLTGDYSISTLWSNLAQTSGQSAAQLQGSLDDVLAHAKQFNADVAQIVTEGGSQSLVMQILGLGPDQGDQLAQSLLALGQAGVAQMSTTIDQIAAYGQDQSGKLAGTFFSLGLASWTSYFQGVQAGMTGYAATAGSFTGPSAGASGYAAAAGGVTNHVTITGPVYGADAQQLAQGVAQQLNQMGARGPVLNPGVIG